MLLGEDCTCKEKEGQASKMYMRGQRVKHLFHRLHLAEGVLRRVVSGHVLFLSPLFNIHEMGSRQQKANPRVSGVAVAVQENHFLQCFKSSCVEDYK